jgi:hypothetical protein
MNPTRIPGKTRTLGVDQAYSPLHIRDDTIDCGPPLGAQPIMVSEWQPTAEERAAIAAGAPVRLKILGQMHPPVLVEVGDVPAPYPVQPRLSPDGERYLCDRCGRSWAPGDPSGCQPCAEALWARGVR